MSSIRTLASTRLPSSTRESAVDNTTYILMWVFQMWIFLLLIWKILCIWSWRFSFDIDWKGKIDQYLTLELFRSFIDAPVLVTIWEREKNETATTMMMVINDFLSLFCFSLLVILIPVIFTLILCTITYCIYRYNKKTVTKYSTICSDQ